MGVEIVVVDVDVDNVGFSEIDVVELSLAVVSLGNINLNYRALTL